MTKFFKNSKKASKIISTLNSDIKDKILIDMSKEILKNSIYIEKENKKDIINGKSNNLSDALMDRLLLNKSRIQDMAQAILDIASLKEPIGKILDGWTTKSNLNIQKVTVPIGVIGIIYESRPNVTSDTAALCFKSGNVCILKGGKEAQYSNLIIVKILQGVLKKNNLSENIISLLPNSSREGVSLLIKQNSYVDLIVPRGGSKLIEYISLNSTVPVIKHDKGLCHTYVDKKANLEKAIKICVNAKCRRVGICGAMETLLVDKKIASTILPLLKTQYDKHDIELRGCKKTIKILDIKKATKKDFYTEYLDNILSIKIVTNVEDAIKHISKYGSGHSDAIVTENYTNAQIFLNNIDSSCVYLNASTQFTDGGEFGFGAEVGISTNKLHARGPMGINELTTYKFQVLSNFSIRK